MIVKSINRPLNWPHDFQLWWGLLLHDQNSWMFSNIKLAEFHVCAHPVYDWIKKIKWSYAIVHILKIKKVNKVQTKDIHEFCNRVPIISMRFTLFAHYPLYARESQILQTPLRLLVSVKKYQWQTSVFALLFMYAMLILICLVLFTKWAVSLSWTESLLDPINMSIAKFFERMFCVQSIGDKGKKIAHIWYWARKNGISDPFVESKFIKVLTRIRLNTFRWVKWLVLESLSLGSLHQII